MTAAYEKLDSHRKVWREKRLLREIYQGWYRRMAGYMSELGPVVEIGGGGGNLKEFRRDIITSDYVFCPWLDLVLDAHALPFQHSSVGTIAAVDVFHHLVDPVGFLCEACDVLVPGGRLILLEPYVSLWSWPVYRFIHPEDVDFSVDPFRGPMASSDKDPFDGNMAVATMLFLRRREELEKRVPGLKICSVEFSDILLYPLSGGFENPAFCPAPLVPIVRRLERLLMPAARFLGYRMLAVLEKSV